MSEQVTIGNYELQLQRTTAELAKKYGKQKIWREIKSIRNADPEFTVISADLRTVAWANTTNEHMANEIVTYWDAMTTYIQTQQQQQNENNNNSNSNSNAMVSIESIPPPESFPPPLGDSNNQSDAQQQPNEPNDSDGPVIPPNINNDYVGWDLTKNYIIYSDGTILYDCRTALNQAHNASQRDKWYHSHKRYVISQFRSMCEKSNALSMLYTINADRLGLPGSVATCMFSPLFYRSKNIEVMSLLSRAMNLSVGQIQERGRLENDIDIDNIELLVFMRNFRQKIQTDAPTLLSSYDASLCEVLKKQNISSVLQVFENMIPQLPVAQQAPPQIEADHDSENENKEEENENGN